MSNTDVNYTREDVSATRIDFTITIPGKEYEDRYEKALAELSSDVKVKGFRAGKAPRNLVEPSKGTEARQKALEELINEYAAVVMEKEKLFPVVPPAVDVADMDDKKNITVVIQIPIIPEIKIPDLSKVKTRKVDVDVEEKEVDALLKRIWQDHRGKFKDQDDKWVESVGSKIGFVSKTIQDLRVELKGAIESEKKRINDETYASAVLAEAIKLAEIELPDQLIAYEAHQREHSFMNTLEQMKITKEEFCEKQGVTMEDLEKQWTKDAKEALETDVFLASYARDRKVDVEEKELETEIALMKQSSKDPNDPMFDNDEWRSYIRRVMLKRKAYASFLSEVRELQDKAGNTAKENSKAPAKK